jgi:site-specific recombinase XerD
MLTLYRRHSKRKCKYTARTEKRCSCPIWVTGTIRGPTISPGRQPLNTRMWRDAEREIERWQQDPENRRVEERESTAIEDAKDKYLVSCQTEKHIQPSTLKSYTKTLEHLCEFLIGKSIGRIANIETEDVRDFLATRREYSPRTRRKELEHIRFFLNYAVENGWIKFNPTKRVKVKIPKGGSTIPLDDDEIAELRAAAATINNNVRWINRSRLRARAMILLMCYSGFRISDVITLKRSEVALDGNIENHVTVKTKSLIFTRLGEEALKALFALPVEGEYFSWSGRAESKLSTATGSARRTLYSLGNRTLIDIHPHRFRDTFAKKILEEIGDIRILQFLLGHRSVKTTEASYAHLGPKHRARMTEALATLQYGKD